MFQRFPSGCRFLISGLGTKSIRENVVPILKSIRGSPSQIWMLLSQLQLDVLFVMFYEYLKRGKREIDVATLLQLIYMKIANDI